jgi:hypothetical protein
MSMIISSLKRRNDALQQECDNLAQGIDRLSAQLSEAYERLKEHDPDYVDEKLGIAPSRAPVMQAAPAAAKTSERRAEEE